MTPDRHWAVVPAAGSGSRMGAGLPKQYLPLAGKTVLEQTLERLLSWELFEGVVVALAPGDTRWNDLPVSGNPRVHRVDGGAERADSVLAGLSALDALGRPRDWAWVHDAARPCVPAADVQALREALADCDSGALLARAVTETVKQADSHGRVETTLDRRCVYLAQTPQVFRLGALAAALQDARRRGLAVTDESSAMELAGQRPRLVPGDPVNIKLTLPADLAQAERWLKENTLCE